MATNFEFYKDEILEIVENGSVAVDYGEPIACSDASCANCLFNSNGGCYQHRMLFNWLYAEHIEAPKLTKRERAFCEAVQTGWIARDKDKLLCWFPDNVEVHKDSIMWNATHCLFMSLLKLPFAFIKWEDEKPWAVEDLLKLEVMEVQKDDSEHTKGD